MSRKKTTEYLTKEQMAALSTKRLLAYRKSLLTLPEWRSGPDAPKWREAHTRALDGSKELLDDREHVG